MPAPSIVLASASRARARMLEAAGVAVELLPAAVDEDAVKAAFAAERRPAAECATALAEAKALRVARQRPGALVVGADQMLVVESAWLDKPVDRAAAAAQLRRLRGRVHELVSAVAVVRDGEVLWHHVDRARLRMRDFSDAFLEDYLDRAGDDVLHSVGAYQLEGLGVSLFAAVDGDFFTILGLPLLPLIGFLRGHGALPS